MMEDIGSLRARKSFPLPLMIGDVKITLYADGTIDGDIEAFATALADIPWICNDSPIIAWLIVVVARLLRDNHKEWVKEND